MLVDASTLARWEETVRRYIARLSQTGKDEDWQAAKVGQTVADEMHEAWLDAIQAGDQPTEPKP
jgi:hypothetical protein